MVRTYGYVPPSHLHVSEHASLAFSTDHAIDVRVVESGIPAITEPTDVICKVTGTTICGSDLHLYRKELLQLQRGDILGHEWCGIVDEVGSEIKNVKKGDRVVASFQIA